MKDIRAETASGTPIECPPPSTNDSGDKLCYCQTCLHVAADSVQYDYQSLNLLVLLDGDELRNDMLVFCRFVLRRQDIVPFDLTDNGQAVDNSAAADGCDRAALPYGFYLVD